MTANRVAVGMAALLFILAVPMPVAAKQNAGSLVLAAGGGGAGFSGDGGPATSARLNNPYGAAVAPDGTLYIADTANHRVRAVSPDGVIDTVAGDGTSAGESGPVPAGTEGTAISLALPGELAVGSDGTLFIADGPGLRVYELAPDGTISLRLDASTGQGVLDRPMRFPRGLAVGGDGTLYVSDRENDRVVAITTGGVVRVVAEVFAPNGLAVDGHDDLWVAAQDLYRVRGDQMLSIINPQADRWTVGAGADQPPPDDALGNVRSVAVRGTEVHVVDDVRHTVRGLSADGTVFTAADLEPAGLGSGPFDLAAGKSLYLIDMVGSRVFVVDTSRPSLPGTPQPDPVWPWFLGGGVAVAALVALVVVVRRRPSALAK
ncbi:NHL domain-containing protein [Actinoplanes subglobosus]|uniref:Teneurin NHL domain-containing protein n=1 Tax=Actinoplanes subglobosus TaxID=1547892 RepID=A0ABV8IYI8_9ACTN